VNLVDGIKCGPEGRKSCLIRARLIDEYGIEQNAIIRNVSTRKIGVTSKGRHLVEGQRVNLILSDGQVLPGCAKIVREDYIDIELCHELNVEIFSDVARHRKEFFRDDAVWGITTGHKVMSGGIDLSKAHKI
jgi:hypothetical protein